MEKRSFGTESSTQEHYTRRVVDSPLSCLIRTYKNGVESRSGNNLVKPDNSIGRTPHIPNKSIDDY